MTQPASSHYHNQLVPFIGSALLVLSSSTDDRKFFFGPGEWPGISGSLPSHHEGARLLRPSRCAGDEDDDENEQERGGVGRGSCLWPRRDSESQSSATDDASCWRAVLIALAALLEVRERHPV